MQLQTVDERRLACIHAGWHLPDDDLPSWPEPSPTDSPQSRRAWLELQQQKPAMAVN